MSFLVQLLDSHGSAITASMAQHLDLPPEEALRVSGKTIPLILGGLARQAQTKGPEAVAAILAEHSEESSLTDLPAFLERQAHSTDPLSGLGTLLGPGALFNSGGLATLFGGGIAKLATSALGAFLNLDATKAAKILPMLAPLTFTALQLRVRENGLDEVLSILAAEGDLASLEELVRQILGGGGPLGGLFRAPS